MFFKKHLEDFTSLNNIFREYKPLKVVNLAAQAGVRYSIDKPEKYFESNISGFFNILEICIKTTVFSVIKNHLPLLFLISIAIK